MDAPGYGVYEELVVRWLLGEHLWLPLAAVGLLIVRALVGARAEFGGRRGLLAPAVAAFGLGVAAGVALAGLGWPLLDAAICGGLVTVAAGLVELTAAVVRRLAGVRPE